MSYNHLDRIYAEYLKDPRGFRRRLILFLCGVVFSLLTFTIAVIGAIKGINTP